MNAQQPASGRSGPGRSDRASAPRGELSVPATVAPGLPPAGSFAELELPVGLTEVLAAHGVREPFPIQAAALPSALAGRDVLGRARTGSGKTLAFGLALLARTAGLRAEPKRPLALVLVPTRELALQVSEALAPYAQALGLRLATVVGGLAISRQAAALHAGAEVVVATPGRLADLVTRRSCRLDGVRIVVLDEADQMCDMGFLPQVSQILDQVPPGGQRLLFSATLDRNVDTLVRRFLTDPVVHAVDPSAGAVATMEHHVLHVTNEDKRDATVRIAAREGRVLLFLDSKRAVDRLAKTLLASGVRAAALHGGKSQPQRTRTLTQFKNGEVTALVATNVAARGIHIDDLDLVVNVDPPADHKDYLHRGGRTARAGESGSVVTLVMPNQRRDMTRLMADAGISPQTTQVRSGEAELSRITGAQAPSGVPVTITAPVVERAKRKAGPSRGRRSGTAHARRAAASPRTAPRGSGRKSFAGTAA